MGTCDVTNMSTIYLIADLVSIVVLYLIQKKVLHFLLMFCLNLIFFSMKKKRENERILRNYRSIQNYQLFLQMR